MIYIPFKHLRPGMILARNLSCGVSVISLLVAGQRLTEQTIEKLGQYEVQGAYIESRVGSDVHAEEFIDPEVKLQNIAELKRLYSDYTERQTISSVTLREITEMAEGLIVQALSMDECLINVIDIKDYDSYTYTHSMYVSILGVLIGVRMGFNHARLLELAMCGLLHDTGKLDISLEIVNKPGSLTSEEFEIMKTHPEKAVQRLRPCTQIPSAVLAGISSHHEKFNGTGYPRGLAGDKIPLYGRILALADVYDALTSQRSYRAAWSPSDAIEYMMGCADTHFDYELLRVFLRTVAAYPVGTIVKLSNGFIAFVVQNSPDNSLRPRIRLVLPEEYAGMEIDLALDTDYLNATICGTIDERTALPDSLFA